MLCDFVFVEECNSDACRAFCKNCGRSVIIKKQIAYKRNCPGTLHSAGTAGTQLTKLLEFFFQVPTKSCKCQSRADHMNAMGNDWCEENIETIVEWLKEEASARGLPFISTVGRILVRRAISNARKEAERATNTT